MGRGGVLSEDLPAHAAWFRLGSVVAGYRLEEQIGAGGMAVVFRARDDRLGRPVALKLLAPGLASDPGFRQRFVRESRAAAAVDDPHIIPIYEAGEADGVLFIAMRFVRGGDLRLVLQREGPLPPDRATAFLSPVASALDAAHAAGLVHRDVKPANILVDARGDRPEHVYLSDFGVSKGASGSVSLTGSGHFLGTPDYSAPEQVQGGVVDGHADQYAMACVAYQMLAGRVPFERDQGMAVLLAHLSEPPPSLCSRRPDLPAAADQVLARALAKAPGNRYRSCGDFADALREALGLAPYRPRGTASAPGHPQTQVGSPLPEFPAPAAAADWPAAPTAGTGPALPRALQAAPSMSPDAAEHDALAAAAMAKTASLMAGRLGAASESGPPAGAGRPASATDVPAAGQRPVPGHGSGGRPQPTWRRRRPLVITLAGAVLAAAATAAAVLASSPGARPTLTYSQFLADVLAHKVKTVELAPSADGMSSGTLESGTSYTVVIPPQAGQRLLNDLQAVGTQITAASSSGSEATLTYSQFIADATAHYVKTVDLASSDGGMSSGTLTNGVSYMVVIPPQAGLPFLNDLRAAGVQITAASSSGSPAALTYSQFLDDVDLHKVKTLDLAASDGGISSGTLTNGTSYTVVIPPQAGQPFPNDLRADGVQVTEASSSGT
jgi:Protein kinase domain/FtsH Extracellular